MGRPSLCSRAKRRAPPTTTTHPHRQAVIFPNSDVALFEKDLARARSRGPAGGPAGPPDGTCFRGTACGEVVGVTFMPSELRVGSSAQARKEFFHELEMLTSLHHPNLAGFKGVCLEPLCVVSEHLPRGSLWDLLRRWEAAEVHGNTNDGSNGCSGWWDGKPGRGRGWLDRLVMLMDVAGGVGFLHDRETPIVHGGLTSRNVALRKGNFAVVTNFGLARCRVADSEDNANLTWLAPEVAVRGEKPTTKSDVYSFAIIMWELLTGKNPWGGTHPKHIHCLLKDGHRPVVPDPLPNDLPGLCEYVDLMKRCWAEKPKDRPEMSDVIQTLKAIWMFAKSHNFKKSKFRKPRNPLKIGIKASRSKNRTVGEVIHSWLHPATVTLEHLRLDNHPAVPKPQGCAQQTRRIDFVKPDDPSLAGDKPRATTRVVRPTPPDAAALAGIRAYVLDKVAADASLSSIHRWTEVVRVARSWSPGCDEVRAPEWQQLLAVMFGSEGSSPDEVKVFRACKYWDELKNLIAEDMVRVVRVEPGQGS